MSWRKVEPLDTPQYEELSSITRSLHLQQAKSSHIKQKLTSHRIESRIVNVNAKVLWFAPTKPTNQNNMYGNVSFTLDWSRAMDQFGPNLYYIDQEKKKNIIYSRVMLTNKRHSNLTPVDTNEARMPMCQLGGKYHVATAGDGLTHAVEFGIEADAKRGKRLYANCTIQANDHSSANKNQYQGGFYHPCICHRFNYFYKVCPSPYTALQTRIMLYKQFPTMLRSEPSWNHDQVVLESDITEEDDDENEYKDDEYIVNYDNHENVTNQVPRLKTDDVDEGSSFYGLKSSYSSGDHGRMRTRDDPSDDDVSYRNARASGFHHMATRYEQDEG